MEHQTKKSIGGIFDNLAFWFLIVFLLLGPFFVLPLWGLSPEVAKRLFASVTVIAVTLLWLVGRLRQGQAILPANFVFLGGLLILVISLISAAVSGSWWNSFIGFGHELDTVVALTVLVLLMFWVSIYFQSIRRLLATYIGLLVAAMVLFLLEFVALLILNFDFLSVLKPMTASIFNNSYSSLIGKWHDFGAYAGLTAIWSLVLLEFFSLRQTPLLRWFAWVIFGLSLAVVMTINHLTIWIILGAIGLFIFGYKSFYWEVGVDRTDVAGFLRSKKMLSSSLLMVLIVILFISLNFGSDYDRQVGLWRDGLGVAVLEVKPSWLGTKEIIKQTYSQGGKYLWLGAGPNRFVDQWVRYKPSEINQTQFWNIDFHSGVGWIPSLLVTNGLLGLLAWLFFFGAIITYGWRAVFNLRQDKTARALLLLSWLGPVYLWTLSFVYISDNGLLLLSFLVTGLFLAALSGLGLIKNFDVSISNQKTKVGLFGLVLMAAAVGLILVGYLTVGKYGAILAYQKGLHTLSTRDDLEAARTLVGRATRWSPQDVYGRALSELDIALAGRLLEGLDQESEESMRLFSTRIESAVASARSAVAANSQNYLNWLTLGRVYEALVPLGFDDAYEQGLTAFTKAQELNPTNPSILLDYFARLEISNNDIAKAKDYASQSLVIKENYAEAVSLLSQIEAGEGQPLLAVRRLEQFLSIFPQYANAGAYLQIGRFQYQAGDYRAAVTSLRRAVDLVPNFANAKYFLGLSLIELGDRSEALRQIKEVEALNPGHPDLTRLLKELTAPVPEPTMEAELNAEAEEL